MRYATKEAHLSLSLFQPEGPQVRRYCRAVLRSFSMNESLF
jgi:hypothetical protein